MKLIKDYINHRILQEVYELCTQVCEKIICDDFNIPANKEKASELYDQIRVKLLEFNEVSSALDDCMLADEKHKEFRAE